MPICLKPKFLDTTILCNELNQIAGLLNFFRPIRMLKMSITQLYAGNFLYRIDPKYGVEHLNDVKKAIPGATIG